ncbi:hypothetical protein EC973_009537 [Apophysomyces ossiformis]|uniref:Uncharacterized protein n=1 Tax=Apophysomyces ossiformis TaxID=679940 RepID=A0A8H7EPI9_9FUNG|nr:hypothetical protein EC973_009537 [Apophysomyces ossiformis]
MRLTLAAIATAALAQSALAAPAPNSQSVSQMAMPSATASYSARSSYMNEKRDVVSFFKNIIYRPAVSESASASASASATASASLSLRKRSVPVSASAPASASATGIAAAVAAALDNRRKVNTELDAYLHENPETADDIAKEVVILRDHLSSAYNAPASSAAVPQASAAVHHDKRAKVSSAAVPAPTAVVSARASEASGMQSVVSAALENRRKANGELDAYLNANPDLPQQLSREMLILKDHLQSAYGISSIDVPKPPPTPAAMPPQKRAVPSASVAAVPAAVSSSSTLNDAVAAALEARRKSNPELDAYLKQNPDAPSKLSKEVAGFKEHLASVLSSPAMSQIAAPTHIMRHQRRAPSSSASASASVSVAASMPSSAVRAASASMPAEPEDAGEDAAFNESDFWLDDEMIEGEWKGYNWFQ